MAGCASVSDIVPNTIKSDSQIALEKSGKIFGQVESEYKKSRDALSKLARSKQDGRMTADVAEYRRTLLDERKAYVSLLIAEARKREAKFSKTARKAGYFAMGTKSVGILSGIAAAVLVAASPANAATVAGLSALSSGTVAFQDTAVEIGLSTVVAEAQREALKGGIYKAYVADANGGDSLKDAPWEYLYSLAGNATQEKWNEEMMKLGKAIVTLEAAVRFARFEIKITGTAKD